MFALGRFALWCVVLALSGCGRTEPLPELPEIAPEGFSPSVRAAIESAWRDAAARAGDASAAGRLGMVLHAHSQFAGARKAYRRASLLDPANFEWRYYTAVVSEGEDALRTFERALAVREYLPARLKLGEAYLAAGLSEQAAKVYRGSDHPAAHFGYARAANDAAHYEMALAAFPQYGAAIYALAQHYQRAGRSADAQRLMSEYPKYRTTAPPVDDPLMDAVRALNRGPDFLLAEAAELERNGRLADAIELHLKALEAEPELLQAHVNLISLYARAGNASTAEHHYRRAVSLNPNAHEAHYNFGVLCYKSNRRREAEAAFGQAIRIHPNYPEAHNNLGTLLQEQGKLGEASIHFKKALEFAPDLHIARFHLGRIYANQRRYGEAIDQFRRAASSGGDSAPAYLYALGATEARAGRIAEARVTLAAARAQASGLGQAAVVASIDKDLARLK